MASYSKHHLNVHICKYMSMYVYTHRHVKLTFRPTWFLDFPCLQPQPLSFPRVSLWAPTNYQFSNVEISLRPPGLCYSLLLPGTLFLPHLLPLFFLVSLSSDITSCRKLSLVHPSDFTKPLRCVSPGICRSALFALVRTSLPAEWPVSFTALDDCLVHHYTQLRAA